MRILTLLTFLFFFTPLASAFSESLQVDGVKVEPIGKYDLERLNRILTETAPQYTGSTVTYSKPTHAVQLYRVIYPSVIPEQGNRPTVASGLLAIPETKEGTPLPLLSYQHGTVVKKTAVPSFIEESSETQLIVAQFAGQGYAVIAPDYFGMGVSPEKEGYIVLQSHRQACTDLLRYSKLILEKKGYKTNGFFTCGWSQGGVVTMSWLEDLERFKMAPTATATAAAQCDAFAMTSGLIYYPRSIDAEWTTIVIILTAFSFEEYYSLPGLAAGVIRPEVYETARKIYLKEPYNEKDYPGTFKQLLRDEYFDPVYFENSQYGRLLLQIHPYRWIIQTPTRMYYGGQDECLKPAIATLPATYQASFGNDKVVALSAGEEANHRQTFAVAVKEWKAWFDSLLPKKP